MPIMSTLTDQIVLAGAVDEHWNGTVDRPGRKGGGADDRTRDRPESCQAPAGPCQLIQSASFSKSIGFS